MRPAFRLRRLARTLLGDTRGATAVEYALIISLIVMAMVGALQAFAVNVTSMWNNVSDNVRKNG